MTARVGVVIGENNARSMAAEAGFTRFEKLEIKNPYHQRLPCGGGCVPFITASISASAPRPTADSHCDMLQASGVPSYRPLSNQGSPRTSS